MLKNILLITILIIKTNSMFGWNSYEFTFIREKKFYNSVITYIKHKNGKLYLIKQKKNLQQNDLCNIKTKLAELIAKTVSDFLLHDVEIIPANKEFIGKNDTNYSALLLSCVPGKRVKSLSKDSLFYLKKIKQGRFGMTKKIIKNMSSHLDLVRMVALDTFIGYNDRNLGNFFYNEKTDRFWAIDMDTCFEVNLSEMAIVNFKKMIQDEKIIFTAQEINSLMLFKNVLQKLIVKNPPEDTIAKMTLTVKQIAGNDSGVIKNFNVYFCEKINQMYYSAIALVKTIEDLIEVKKLYLLE